MRISPLGDALGAEVAELDLRQPLDDAVRAALRRAFLDHHLLCFRAVPLPAADFARVARCFGEPQIQLLRHQRHPEAPEVSILDSTYRRAEDKPDDLALVRLSCWHTDDSYLERPAKATMLQALEIPSSGGETLFANTRRAYEDLPPETKARLEGRRAVHAYDTRRARVPAAARTEEERRETPDVVHPLVRTHEDTGARAIYFNPGRTDAVVGLDRGESDALLDELHEHITAPRYRYRHRWRVGDILLWDNRCLVHSVDVDYPVGEPRRHQRILLAGPRPA